MAVNSYAFDCVVCKLLHKQGYMTMESGSFPERTEVNVDVAESIAVKHAITTRGLRGAVDNNMMNEEYSTIPQGSAEGVRC